MYLKRNNLVVKTLLYIYCLWLDKRIYHENNSVRTICANFYLRVFNGREMTSS